MNSGSNLTPELLQRAYAGRSVDITGGASFIGSHLVNRLVGLDADVIVVDDRGAQIEELDLSGRSATLAQFPHAEYVFHLARTLTWYAAKPDRPASPEELDRRLLAR